MRIESMTESEAIGKWDAEISKKEPEKRSLDEWMTRYAIEEKLPIAKHQQLLSWHFNLWNLPEGEFIEIEETTNTPEAGEK